MKIGLFACTVIAILCPNFVHAQQYFCQNGGDSIQSSSPADWEKAVISPGTLVFSVSSSGTYRDSQANVYLQGEREILASCEIWRPSKGFGQCSNSQQDIRLLLYRSRETGATEFILHAQDNGLQRLGLARRIDADSVVIKGACVVR